MQAENKSLYFKALSILIALALLIACVPNQVYALAGEALSVALQQSNVESTPVQTETASRGVYEVAELREENVKHFALEDGTYAAVMYGLPVHSKDDDGRWQDIDNRLSDSGSEFTTNDARIKFAKKITGNEVLFTLHDGSRKITMSLNNASKKTTGSVTNTSTEFDSDASELQKLMTLDNLSSQILYPDILEGVDLEYVVESLNVKENIIVKEPRDNYQYTFTIALNNLEAALSEDGSVQIFDSSTFEVVYNIPAGFMYDANGEYSTAVTYTLTDNGNGKYSLTVTADAEWVNATERAFPVVIDPTTEADGLYYIQETSIHQYMPNDTGNEIPFLAAGPLGIAYCKISKLPTLPNGSDITDAKLVLTGYQSSLLYPNTCTTMTLGAYSVTSDWDPATLCYSQYTAGLAGQFEPSAFDAQVGQDENGQYTFDITSKLQDWYADPNSNFGIAITAIEADFLLADPLYRFTCSYQNAPLCIYYTNTIGVEDYWSFSTQSAAMSGMGYVNNATGQLSFAISTLTATDSLFAFTPMLVYNQTYAGQYVTYDNSQMPYVQPMAGYGFKWNMCETIVSYSYVQDGARKNCYIWTDSDGTEHQFVQSGDNIYKDIDGLLLTLEVNGDTYTITDLNHNVRTFSTLTNSEDLRAGGILTSITDKNGNKLEFVPDTSGRITRIRMIPMGGNAIEQLTITYNANGLPQSVENAAAGQKIVFYYSASYDAGTWSSSGMGYLRKYAYYQDGDEIAEFYYEYDGSGRLISAYDSFSEYIIGYSYSDSKVSEICEVAISQTVEYGQTIGLTYGDSFTEIRTSGTDDAYGTSDDIITVYIFDEQNRVSSYYSTDVGRTQIYGAASGEYEEQENVKNNLKTSVSVGGASSNYLYNGGFESYRYRSTLAYNQALGWSHLPNVTIVNYADQITNISSVTGEHCYAYFDLEHDSQHTLYQDVTLPAGQYTLSFDLQCFYTLNVDARVKVVSLSDTTRSFEKAIPLDDYDASQGSITVSMNFEAIDYNNTGCEEVRILIAVECGSLYDPTNSYITLDNVMLEENIGYSGYSVVEFGNFEDFSDESSYKTHWGSTATTVFDSELLGNVLVVNPGQMFTQTIYSANATQATIGSRTYTISGMAKGTNQYASGDFRIKAIVEYHDSTEQDIINFDFQYNSTEWQFVCRNFTTRSGLKVKTIQLCLEYNNNPGVAYFDNIYATQVISDTTVTTEYYDDGLVQVRKNGYYTEVYEYDENNNLIRLANNRGQIYDYTYTETNDIATSTYYTFVNSLDNTLVYPYQYVSPDNYITKIPATQTIYTYNTYGQITKQVTFEVEYSSAGTASQEIVKKADTQYVTTEYGYYITAGSKIFGALAYSVDNNGVETRYYMDEDTGYLLMVVNAETRTGTYYTYDALGNVKTVTPATYSAGEFVSVNDAHKVEYTYNSANQLETITTRSTRYTFNYDVFGKTDSILVGNNQIVSYEYNDHNGKMTAIHYANGDSLEYVYDELENVSEVWYIDDDPNTEDLMVYAYSYNAYGQLYRFDNLVSKQSIIYEYDTNKRLVGFVEFDTEDASNSMSASVKYNDKSQITRLSYAFDYGYNILRVSGEDLSYYYYYNDDGSVRLTQLLGSIADGTISYSYDSFKRLNQKVYDYTSTYEDTIITKTVRFTNTVSYTYVADSSNNTSLLIQTYCSQVNDNAAVTYTYEYDDNGNITKITLSTGEQYRYMYDDLGQLLREDNAALGRTYVYEYDYAGNITKKYTYALTVTNVTPTNPISTDIYGYGDEDWGDLLTSYRGQTITYDEIGNPLSYYNGQQYTFTWENGRRLATATVGGTNLTFTYNDEGIRTSKKVGNTEHIYHLNGTQIVFEEYGETVTVYLYDAEGSPIGMQYRMGNADAGVFEEYWFEKNLQGDIVAVYDGAGKKLISYTYDAWGNFTTTYHNDCTSSHHANLNPFRYRGYYYDSELGMYYLQSRYYDPLVGRYINADGYVSTGQGLLGYNMYTYCGNNPVNRVDPEGKSWIAVLVVVAICALVLTGCDDSEGAATPYAPSDSTNYNCYAYALGEDEWKHVGGYEGAVDDYDVNHVADMVLEDVRKDGRSIRIIDSHDSPIEKNEYRIALRTGESDYHFMVQHSDGSWSHKPGICKTRLIDGNNPSVVSWDAPQIDLYAWVYFGIVIEIGYEPNYYDSETIYFAVSR